MTSTTARQMRARHVPPVWLEPGCGHSPAERAGHEDATVCGEMVPSMEMTGFFGRGAKSVSGLPFRCGDEHQKAAALGLLAWLIGGLMLPRQSGAVQVCDVGLDP
jgi:hypothetical protein